MLITDLIMPEMNRRDLAGQIIASYPTIKCLYMSGHTAAIIDHKEMLEKGFQLIQKPFSSKDLSSKPRATLSTRIEELISEVPFRHSVVS